MYTNVLCLLFLNVVFLLLGLNCAFPTRVEHGDFVHCSEAGKLIVTYSCHQGYELLGEEQLSCIQGKWNLKAPVCQGAYGF